MIRITFACSDDAGRASMAAAFFNAMADSHIARAVSCGLRPARHVHAHVLQVMSETGVRLDREKPRAFDPSTLASSRMLVVLGSDLSPANVPPTVRRVVWDLEDPAGRSIDEVRAIRDHIRSAVRTLIAELGWGPGVWI